MTGTTHTRHTTHTKRAVHVSKGSSKRGAAVHRVTGKGTHAVTMKKR
jgi:hypothetical protein